jgi:hypothetical protein
VELRIRRNECLEICPTNWWNQCGKKTMDVNNIEVHLNVFYIRIRGDCTVSKANGCGLVCLGLIPERERKFPLRQHVQIACGAHPVSPISCGISTGGPRVKPITHRHLRQDPKRVDHASRPSACHGIVQSNNNNKSVALVRATFAYRRS